MCQIDDVYKKLDLISSADEKGKLWEIVSKGEILRMQDMVELAYWIARELGWIKRNR